MVEFVTRDALKAVFEDDGHLSAYVEEMIDSIPAADVVPGVDYRDCRNELCYNCGSYQYNHETHECDGCRWRSKKC